MAAIRRVLFNPYLFSSRSFFQRFCTTKTTETSETNAEKINVEKNEIFEKLDTEYKELKDKYMRALAETENLRRRNAEQMDNLKKFSIQAFSKDLLEVADVLTMALDSFEKDNKEMNENDKNLREGVNMTKTVLLKVFAKHGVEPIWPEGEKFDPNLHDAIYEVSKEESQYKPGHIAKVLNIGYHMHGRPIRPSKVAVVKD